MNSYYQNSLELDRIRRAKEREKANARAAFLARVNALGFAPEGSSVRDMIVGQFDTFQNDLTGLLSAESERVRATAFAAGRAEAWKTLPDHLLTRAEREKRKSEAVSGDDDSAWYRAHGFSEDEIAKLKK